MLASRGILNAQHYVLGTSRFNRASSVGPDIVSSQFQEEISKMDLSQVPFQVLSDIHESYLARKLILDSTGQLQYAPESALRKSRGIYYTPGYIVRYIIHRTLGRYLWRTESGRPETGTPARTPDDIRRLRVLDPACGSGCFLACAFDVLAEFYAQHQPHAENEWLNLILQNHLCGIDLDSDAADITSAILILKALDHMDSTPAQFPELSIRQGNFLVPQTTADPQFDSIHMMSKLPECTEGDGVTMILGNPPYGAKLTQTERKLIRSSYETYRSSDSSSLFIEKAVRTLTNDGILGFIVPKSLTYVVSWCPIRQFLMERCAILEMADARKAFKGVLLEQMVIIAQKRRKRRSRTVVSILRPERSIVSHSVENSDLSPGRFSIWISSPGIRHIVDRMWEKSVPLGQVARIWNGLSIQNLPIFSEEAGSECKLPCLRGKDIQRYHVRQGIQYIKMTDALKRRRPSLDMFGTPRIIAQDIVAYIQNPRPHIKIMATIDESGTWLNVNTVTNITSSAYPLPYLCGILNSRLISWYAYNFIYNRSIRTMHFRRGYADHIPIRRIDRDFDQCKPICEQLMEHVHRIIALYDGSPAPENAVAKLDREIDGLIYQLYGITQNDLDFLRTHAALY